MSSRHFRKMAGGSLPDHDSDSDGAYDPMGNRRTNKTTYAGLQISSDSENGNDYASDDATQAAISIAYGGARKKVQKKNGRKGKKSKKPGGTGDPGSSTSPNGCDGQAPSTLSSADQQDARQRQGPRRRNSRYEELDDIDRSLMEINDLLGPPPPAPVNKTTVRERSILEIQVKHLNVANELKRMFGPDEPDEVRQRLKTQPHRARLLRRVLIQPASDTNINEFRKSGLTMSISNRDKDVTYFVYDHDEHHQKMHNAFLQRYAITAMNQDINIVDFHDAQRFMHVESLLEIADSLFRMEENTMAVELVENMVAYLQYVAHPSFNLASTNVRLLYTYVENRPFHVVMLKYIYLLTNRACHRTALEIAKMLINIDPSDPLAVLFIIDTLALRAREHKWLIEAIEYFNHERQASLLFNIQYSNALAHYHVANKNKYNTAEADNLLQQAILSYPQVAVKILEFGHNPEPRIQGHVLFASEPITRANEAITELMMIYAKLIWPKFREPQVKEWFHRNIVAVADNYDSSEDVQFRARQLMALRQSIFQSWPDEILRHVTVIRSMTNLLIETTLYPSTRITSSWDPLFDRGINRYGYRTPADPPNNPATGGRALLYRFFTSILPNSGLDPPAND